MVAGYRILMALERKKKIDWKRLSRNNKHQNRGKNKIIDF
jgi:hypothetical protein